MLIVVNDTRKFRCSSLVMHSQPLHAMISKIVSSRLPCSLLMFAFFGRQHCLLDWQVVVTTASFFELMTVLRGVARMTWYPFWFVFCFCQRVSWMKKKEKMHLVREVDQLKLVVRRSGGCARKTICLIRRTSSALCPIWDIGDLPFTIPLLFYLVGVAPSTMSLSMTWPSWCSLDSWRLMMISLM